MAKILIEVKGGVVQSVTATESIDVFIHDWDNVEGADDHEDNNFKDSYDPEITSDEAAFMELIEKNYNQAKEVIEKILLR